MSETITPALRAYLTDWLAWAEAGAPPHPEFDPDQGLCSNAPGDAAYDLRDALVVDFGGEDDTPFSTPERPYWLDANNEAHHTNPLRLAWVRAQLAKPTGA